MKIQSLSVVVPNRGCVNNCPFCVSRMHCDSYKNLMDDDLPQFDLHLKDYLKRLDFARDNGCNTLMLTGTSEPQQNRKFLTYFGMMLRMMQRPFRWIEMQTTGTLLNDDYLRFLRSHVGVNVISLSVSSLSNRMNNAIIGTSQAGQIDLPLLCSEIKKHGFTLRLSLNLTNEFRQFDVAPQSLFRKCRELGADQATLRVLYSSENDTPQDQWIAANGLHKRHVNMIRSYITENGRVLGVLPHGAVKYSLDRLCVVIDGDCMDKAEKTGEDYKYLILQPDCKLYSAWDDPASLIF